MKSITQPTLIVPSPHTLSASEKKILLSLLLFSVTCSGTIDLNVMSFFPLYVKQNFGEDKISTSMVSVCMTSFELAGILTSRGNASMISKMGRKNSLIIGFIIIFLSTMSLGMISLIETTEWRTFYFAAMASRFAQGCGDGLVITTCFSLIGSNFSEEKTKYYGMIEAALGFGLVIGPPVGSFLYGYFGYAWTFYSISVLMGINIILCLFLLPNKLNKNRTAR